MWQTAFPDVKDEKWHSLTLHRTNQPIELHKDNNRAKQQLINTATLESAIVPKKIVLAYTD